MIVTFLDRIQKLECVGDIGDLAFPHFDFVHEKFLVTRNLVFGEQVFVFIEDQGQSLLFVNALVDF